MPCHDHKFNLLGSETSGSRLSAKALGSRFFKVKVVERASYWPTMRRADNRVGT